MTATKTAQHTPGPWTDWKPAGFDPRVAGVKINVSADGRSRSVAQIGRQADVAEWEANARLIATAPDLLAQLRYLRSCRVVKDEMGACLYLAPGDAENLDAAIAKAEGRA